MYSRSEIRHACFRAKNKVATEKNKQILSLIEPMLEIHQRWENFSDVWDVIVTKDKQIKIVTPEKDKDFIHTTLLKASLYKELGKDFTDLEDREYNIVVQVEQIMLDKIMNWSNYNKTWGVVFDEISNVLKTVQYNVNSNQITVTQEMIEASKKDADGNPFIGEEAEKEQVALELKPMDEYQKKQFEEFLAKKYKG